MDTCTVLYPAVAPIIATETQEYLFSSSQKYRRKNKMGWIVITQIRYSSRVCEKHLQTIGFKESPTINCNRQYPFSVRINSFLLILSWSCKLFHGF